MAVYDTAKLGHKFKRSVLGVDTQLGLDLLTKPTRFHFWYLGVLRLCVGIGQIVVVVWCFVLLIRQGINAQTMHVAFIGVGITTASLILFKILNRWIR